MPPTFFESPADFRRWLKKNHAKAGEFWVGFHKRGTGKPSLTWPESVEEALCFGWIDGIRKSINAARYMIRFTPRKPTSTWSAINIKTANRLIAEGRMQAAGLAAFQARKDRKSAIYSYENRPQALDLVYERTFRRNRVAWAFFQKQPPWYRRTASYWVMSAKLEETRQRRLATLIADSAKGRPIGPLTRKPPH
jgi:uncharacterized protein YdeI (YjbR/CyaY-like superfamily)